MVNAKLPTHQTTSWIANTVTTPPETALSAQPGFHRLDSSENSFQSAPPDPDNPPWSLLQAFLTWIASVVLLLLPQLIALPYLVSHYRGLRPTPEVLFADKTFIIIVVSGILPAHLITLILAWAVVTRLGKVSARKALGWSWEPRFGLWQSVGLGFLLLVMTWLIAVMLGEKETDMERILLSSRTAALLIAFIATATAPLVEEIIYRGVLYPALQRSMGAIPAVIIVTLMFAGPHVPQYWPNLAAISSITLLSVVLTVIRARTGRLLPCFVIHLVFNGIQSLIIVFLPNLQALLEHWRPQAPTGALTFFMRFLG
jgi:membrane protease YdiL (CAAX protease family)